MEGFVYNNEINERVKNTNKINQQKKLILEEKKGKKNFSYLFLEQRGWGCGSKVNEYLPHNNYTPKNVKVIVLLIISVQLILHHHTGETPHVGGAWR